MVIAMSLAACAPSEVEDLFDESAAARLDNAVKNYTEYFKKDGGRWLMQYFANADEEGVNFILNFKNDGSVEISTQNVNVGDGTFQSDVSLWQVVADYGPVLSFNTYNKVFHEFSSPQSDGTGHGGDYEFIIIGTEDNQAHLRGKKTGIDIIMTRLGSDVAATDADYFAAYTAKRAKAFNARLTDYVLTTANGKRYICNDVSTMLWSFYPEDGTLLDNGEYMNAIMTLDGLRFMQPLDFVTEYNENDVPLQNFKFQDDGSLLCTDDGASLITGPAPVDALQQTTVTWTFNASGFGGEFATAYTDLVAQCKEAPFKQTFNWMQLRMYQGKFGIYFKNGRYTGNIYLGIERIDGNTVKFTFDPNDDASFDANGKTHYTRLEAMQRMLSLLTSTEFTLSSESVMVPNPMVGTSKANSANSFTIGFQ